MSALYFLTVDDVVQLYERSVVTFGGSAGIRDIKLLESAIFQPQAIAFDEYLHSDIFEMAAAYCFHLIKNHPFIDGNKRIGILTTMVFLEKNGFHTDADPDELYLLAVHVASSSISKEDIAVFLRKITVT